MVLPRYLLRTGHSLKRYVTVALTVFISLMIYVYMQSSWHKLKTRTSPGIPLMLQQEFQTITEDSSTKKPGCIIPSLNLKHPDIMKFFKVQSAVSCGDDVDWTSLKGGKFVINEEIDKKYGPVKCDLIPLEQKTDFETLAANVKKLVDVKSGTPITHEFYIVECKGNDGKTYRNYHAGAYLKPNVVERKTQKTPNTKDASLDLDIIMIGQDSLSHMAWMRHMPLTRKYLVEILNATEMWGHTVVGDGTPATMFPMLTGKREEELPESRRGYKGAKHVDGYPWIWKELKEAGYVTAWQEDQPQLGTFHYRLLGFEQPPVDHYYRPFAVYYDRHSQHFKPQCLGGTPRHVALNNYMKDVYDVYKGQRRFGFSFKSENSHEDNNAASKIDEHMRNHLKDLYDDGHLDNALLILMADHGARFAKIRAFAQGKQEERMPYFAMRLPETFRVKHPDIMKNLKINSQRLTTPFDVHETFHEIIHYTGSGKADISKRGVSLFKEIPIERDCKSADVDPHWCFCLDWSPISIKDDVVNLALKEVMFMLNKITDPYRSKCHQLAIKSVISASEMKMKDDVLKFKNTNDGGRGRFGKMNDKTTRSNIVYQITFVTSPGNGLFEVTVSRDLNTKQFTTDLTSVSRINRYGKAPWCIMEQIPQIRPYCVCKQPPHA